VPLIRGITEATEAVSQRGESLTGRLRVTAPVSFGTNFLGLVIAEFAKRHPELEIGDMRGAVAFAAAGDKVGGIVILVDADRAA
jgi:DNA-binding transcriptional LysR family regulator